MLPLRTKSQVAMSCGTERRCLRRPRCLPVRCLVVVIDVIVVFSIHTAVKYPGLLSERLFVLRTLFGFSFFC